ncbi:hypothetical protein OAJ07_02890 [Gemmatimonadales bacterium]|jgi:hypothetical protein|nr:hypothetical protein [Gemmatimonadales bacterium]
MSGGGIAVDGADGSEDPLHILRAKYHDYCSAQVTDLLVYMSPDEIYTLAHSVLPEDVLADDISYTEMIRIATEWLSRRVALPPFEVWVQDYKRHPYRYDEYLLGLWKREVVEE